MDKQLIKLIDSHGLDKTKSEELLDNFSGYFEMAAEWERKANELVITDVTQKEEMKLAREGRLFLKDKRIAVEKTRKMLKEASLREGQTIDAIAKVLTNLIVPIEKNLEEKEKFAEIQEKKRIEALRDERTREIEPYIEFVPYGLDFGTMDDDSYKKVLDGAKLQKKAKEEADRKAEQERIAREKAEAEERERIRKENERLRKEAEIQAIKIAKEREERERQIRIEREKREKLEAEQKAEKARLEAERLEAERKAAAEKRAKEEAERKARNAPDKEKLQLFFKSISNLDYPDVKSEEAKNIINHFKNKIEELTAQAEKEITNL